MTLRGVTGYDPDGTGPPGEHNADAPKATDGDEATFWSTETYSSPAFGNLKPGVGLVLDAGGSVKLGSLTVTTDTPGYTAKILAGDSRVRAVRRRLVVRDRRRLDDVRPERRDRALLRRLDHASSRRATSPT